MFRVTGPVTRSTSACRGLATKWMPKRSRSKTGLAVAAISSSQPLQLPASTCRTWSERPKRPRIRAARASADWAGEGPGPFSSPRNAALPVTGSTSKDARRVSCSRV